MNKRDMIKELFEKGKEAGLTDMEVFVQGGKNIDLAVFKGEIDKYSIAKEEGLSFRGLYKGKMGYAYTEKIDESSIDMLIKEVIDNAKNIDSDDEELIFEGSNHYEDVHSYNDALEKVSVEEKIQLTKDLEQEALSLDDRVVAVNYCIYGEETSETLLINTKGLDLENKSNIAYAYISVMVKENEQIKTAGKYIVTKDYTQFNAKALAKEAVNEALSMLGAQSVQSNDYPVILKNNVAADILDAFSPIFSAESVQKDVSLLKGKLEEEIAVSIVTVVDDPLMATGVASKSFDGEGVATKTKKVIDRGVLKTYLHNSKTAKKDGVETTGNANKSSYKSLVGIAPTNMYMEPGHTSLDQMVSSIDDGLLIINVEGLHAGLNPVSGDFSLSAYGYKIEKGTIGEPVEQITIAGNFFSLMKNIQLIGNDLKFGLPSGGGYIGAPSLKIASLAVAGE